MINTKLPIRSSIRTFLPKLLGNARHSVETMSRRVDADSGVLGTLARGVQSGFTRPEPSAFCVVRPHVPGHPWLGD